MRTMPTKAHCATQSQPMAIFSTASASTATMTAADRQHGRAAGWTTAICDSIRTQPHMRTKRLRTPKTDDLDPLLAPAKLTDHQPQFHTNIAPIGHLGRSRSKPASANFTVSRCRAVSYVVTRVLVRRLLSDPLPTA